MYTAINKEDKRIRRHYRIRKRILGNPERPRLAVHRSHKNLYLQLVDDIAEKTLAALSTDSGSFRKACPKGGNVEAAKKLGALAADLFKSKGYAKIVFDRGGYLYHGRVKALAEALRAGGLQF